MANLAPGGGASHAASAEQGLATARLQRDRLLRQLVDLRGQVQVSKGVRECCLLAASSAVTVRHYTRT